MHKKERGKLNVLMVGVDSTSIGGMLSVANSYKNDTLYNDKVNLTYIATATRKNTIQKCFFFIRAIIKTAFVLYTKKIDIVHIHMAEKTSVYRKYVIMEMARLAGCKVVVQLHAGPFLGWYNTLNQSQKSRVKQIINTPDKLLVLGEYWLNELSSIVERRKLDVLYNGVEIPRYNPYNIESRDISFFAHLKKEKGIFDLLEAVEKIKDKIPKETKVNLCGSSDEFDIEAYLQNHGLCETVNYCGWVSGTRKKEIIDRTAICVLPTYIEGLSMTILESMAQGIPIITTNVTTMPEMLNGIADMIVPGDTEMLANQMVLYIENKDLRDEISKKEYSRAIDKFSVKAMVYKTLAIYGKVLGE